MKTIHTQALITFAIVTLFFNVIAVPIYQVNSYGGENIYLPIVQNQFALPPLHSVSRYVSEPTKVWSWGCEAARSHPGVSLVILNFGQPWYQDNVYGVRMFDGKVSFIPADDIIGYVQGFALGYRSCSGNSNSFVAIGVGLNNYKDDYYITKEHGQVWAEKVNYLQSWVLNCGENCNLSAKMRVVGAMDIEAEWGSATATRAWVDGYSSTVIDNIYYNFGTCDSCPYIFLDGSGHPEWIPANNWTLEDIYYVSWSAGDLAFPIPEIYDPYGINAYQWQNIKKTYDPQMEFRGVMTQWGACQTRPPCSEDEDNKPSEGWLLLYKALNNDPLTKQEPPRWVTDITWDN